MRKYSISLVIVSFCALASANAWANACDRELSETAVSRTQIENSDYLRTDLAVRLAAMTAGEARDYLTGDMSLPIAGLPLQPGFTDETFTSFQQWVRSKLDLQFAAEHRAAIRLSSGDPVLIGAWERCLSRVGGLSLIVIPKTTNFATLTMEWWPTAGSGSASPRMKALVVRGGYIAVGTEWRRRKNADLGVGAKRTVLLYRIPGHEMRVTVRTDLTDEEAYLAPVL